MSQEEREKWNAIHGAGREGERFSGEAVEVCSWVLPHLRPGSRVLDLGAGRLRNSLPFAAAGHEVLAVDIAEKAFEGLDPLPRGVETLVADLDAWRPEPESFDCILAVHYLNRELAPRLAEALRPGGFLALEIRVSLPEGPERPRFRLLPGEAFALHHELEVLRFMENADKEGGLGRYLFRLPDRAIRDLARMD